jgi:hypothetical protein
MKLRLSLAVLACLVGASLIPGTAAADRPTLEEFSPVGDQFACDGTLVTVTGGTVVSRRHVHELRSGLFRVIFIERPRLRATDEEGTVYRLVGSSRGSFTTPDPEAEDPEVAIGSFDFKLNIIGPGGLLGKVRIRIQVKRNGEEIVREEKSTCESVADED